MAGKCECVGSFFDDVTSQCVDCTQKAECAKCSIDKGTCEECLKASKTVLKDGICVECATNEFCGTTGTCESCDAASPNCADCDDALVCKTCEDQFVLKAG